MCNKWTKCSDKLPEYGTHVLVCDETGYMAVDYLVEGEEYCWCIATVPVIAWMPLPEPPEYI